MSKNVKDFCNQLNEVANSYHNRVVTIQTQAGPVEICLGSLAKKAAEDTTLFDRKNAGMLSNYWPQLAHALNTPGRGQTNARLQRYEGHLRLVPGNAGHGAFAQVDFKKLNPFAENLAEQLIALASEAIEAAIAEESEFLSF